MKHLIAAFLCAVAAHGLAAARDIPLWQEGVPGAREIGPEKVEHGRTYAVAAPALTVFPAPGRQDGATAIIVAPGGSYHHLATAREGEDYAHWLNGLGVTVFLLKYRLAEFGHPAPLRDILRAVRLVRAQAAAYHIDPARIGVLGSSAGGHLAASALTLFDHADGRTGAALDAVSARPDFGILVYPVITLEGPAAHQGSRRNLLGADAPAALVRRMSLETQVTPATPPTLLVHTQADRSVPAENSLLFYQALARAGVPAELHVFEGGGHGIGLRPGLGTASGWPRRVEDWLAARRLIAR